ncbi:MAG: type II toxin-antitoxin system HicB family antitoxin [Armatimonadetes bacterium]|nr:type II toxin-antitoxin system HicB family antitoxin [Armatimonadota bacterium]
MAEYHVRFSDGRDGWVIARTLELPGAVSQGRTVEEAREMIEDAIAELLASYREDAERGGGVWGTVQVEA